MQTKDKLGVRLRQLRKERQITQDELAEKLNSLFSANINKSMISKWENGKGSPYLAHAACLAEFFSVSLDYLIGLSDEKQSLYLSPPAGEKELLALHRQLNAEGQERLLAYADDLCQSGKYIKTDFSGLVAGEA